VTEESLQEEITQLKAERDKLLDIIKAAGMYKYYSSHWVLK